MPEKTDQPEIMNRPCPLPGPDTLLLTNSLRGWGVSKIVSYDELTKLLGYDCRSRKGYARLRSALKALKREGIEFRTHATVGLERLSAVGIAEKFAEETHSVNRRANRAMKTGLNVPVSDLPEDKKAGYLANLSQVAVLRELSTKKAQLKLQNLVVESQQQLPLLKTLEAFKNGSP
jgi:hypothetical protein